MEHLDLSAIPAAYDSVWGTNTTDFVYQGASGISQTACFSFASQLTDDGGIVLVRSKLEAGVVARILIHVAGGVFTFHVFNTERNAPYGSYAVNVDSDDDAASAYTSAGEDSTTDLTDDEDKDEKNAVHNGLLGDLWDFLSGEKHQKEEDRHALAIAVKSNYGDCVFGPWSGCRPEESEKEFFSNVPRRGS